jgi:hypothetical protein
MCCAVIVGGFWLGVDQESVAGNECYFTSLFNNFKFIIRILNSRTYNGLSM